MTDILNVINILSKKLQSKDGTLAASSGVINGVIKTLEEKRSGDAFSSLWKEIVAFAKDNNIDIESTRNSKRKRTESRLLKDYAVMSTTGSNDLDSIDSNQSNTEPDSVSLALKDSLRINIYFRILDTIIGHLKIRFSPESQEMANAVDNFFKFDFEASSSFIDHYAATFKINREVLKAEMLILKHTIKNKDANNEINISDIKKT